jgi:RimJ/RimL family protein N-acetyltransferase
MQAGDVDALLAVFGDPRVMAAFAASPFDRLAMQCWVERSLQHQQRHGHGLFSMLHRQDGCLIGDCGIEYKKVLGVEQPELGYDLRSDNWNRGLATEATEAMRDHAFSVLKLTRLISMVRVGNASSRRVAEKIGMRMESEATVNGVDYLIYAASSASA